MRCLPCCAPTRAGRLEHKESLGTYPFERMKVRVKREIVTLVRQRPIRPNRSVSMSSPVTGMR